MWHLTNSGIIMGRLHEKEKIQMVDVKLESYNCDNIKLSILLFVVIVTVSS